MPAYATSLGVSPRTLRSKTEVHSTGSSGGRREGHTRIVPTTWSKRPQYPSSGPSRHRTAGSGTTRPRRWFSFCLEVSQLLPALIRRFDGVDDPYVIERLAVVSHGAVLRGGLKAEPAAVAVAKELKQVAFGATQIPNIITRDAVRGVHEWCARHGLIEDLEYAATLPPYGADPPAPSQTEEQLDHAYGSSKYRRADIRWPYADVFMSIFMLGDFGRYVIQSRLDDFSEHAFSSDLPPPTPGHGRRVATYPVESAKCWVFERVLSLGWTPQRFENFDSHWAPRPITAGPHKAERFGKKYQWIAVRELLARVADNFHMRDHFGGRQRTYAGPWQLYGRDIDPTLPPPRLLRNEHDESEVSPTFASDDDVWWVSPGPSYEPDDPPVGEGWAVDHEGVPEFESMVRRKDDSKTRWVVLHAYHDWKEKIPEDEERSARRRRELWSHVYSWLVRSGDRDALVAHLERRSLAGRWMPLGRDTDAAYLGEAPSAAAAEEEEPDPDREFKTGDGERSKSINIRPGWEVYCWEGNVLDCSIEDSVTAEMPDRILFEAGELTWIHALWIPSAERIWRRLPRSTWRPRCSRGADLAMRQTFTSVCRAPCGRSGPSLPPRQRPCPLVKRRLAGQRGVGMLEPVERVLPIAVEVRQRHAEHPDHHGGPITLFSTQNRLGACGESGSDAECGRTFASCVSRHLAGCPSGDPEC